jgi:hypothetical protein
VILVSLYGYFFVSFERRLALGKVYDFPERSERLYPVISTAVQPVFLSSIYSPAISSPLGFGRRLTIPTVAKTWIGSMRDARVERKYLFIEILTSYDQ